VAQGQIFTTIPRVLLMPKFNSNKKHLVEFLSLLGLPDFSGQNIPKWGKIYLINTKYTEGP
jgi:hypothetical protein